MEELPAAVLFQHLSQQHAARSWPHPHLPSTPLLCHAGTLHGAGPSFSNYFQDALARLLSWLGHCPDTPRLQV